MYIYTSISVIYITNITVLLCLYSTTVSHKSHNRNTHIFIIINPPNKFPLLQSLHRRIFLLPVINQPHDDRNQRKGQRNKKQQRKRRVRFPIDGAVRHHAHHSALRS